FLAAKDEQLVVFKVEMDTLKENLREEEIKPCAIPWGAHKDTWKLQLESQVVASNVHQWVKEQKNNTEKLGSRIREQVKCISQLADEKESILLLYTKIKKTRHRQSKDTYTPSIPESPSQ
uniref:Uncharacterized protein n=1 Tax=Monodelphis domestica TaxID=13616 RepID=A0A5F8GI81_MONDO